MPTPTSEPNRVTSAVRNTGPSSLRCAWCHDDFGVLKDAELLISCGGCDTRLHRDCAREARRCPTLGCGRSLPRLRPVPSAAGLGPLAEIPALAAFDRGEVTYASFSLPLPSVELFRRAVDLMNDEDQRRRLGVGGQIFEKRWVLCFGFGDEVIVQVMNLGHPGAPQSRISVGRRSEMFSPEQSRLLSRGVIGLGLAVALVGLIPLSQGSPGCSLVALGVGGFGVVMGRQAVADDQDRVAPLSRFFGQLLSDPWPGP